MAKDQEPVRRTLVHPHDPVCLILFVASTAFVVACGNRNVETAAAKATAESNWRATVESIRSNGLMPGLETADRVQVNCCADLSSFQAGTVTLTNAY